MAEQQPTYDAFISYSHAVDGLRARKLRAALTRFAKPWWRRRALVVFQDEASLSANPALWSSIAAAMQRCRYFVLMASPEAAGSEWVAREIEHWRATKPAGTLLPVLTAGEWEWDDDTGTFDWKRSTAVPRALADVFTEEPRHVDLRWPTTEDDLDLRHTEFRKAVVDLVAPIRGVAREDLEGDDVREHRRTRRTIAVACAALLLQELLGDRPYERTCPQWPG